MRRSPLLALVLILAFGAAAFFADITGRWVGSVSTPNGDFQIVYTFQATGETLTGALETPNGSGPIRDGTVNGDEIAFVIDIMDGAMRHTGTVTGDTLVLRSDFGELKLVRTPAE